MEKKIKLTYLLLGLGIGILFTSTLYSIFPNIEYIELDDDIIIEKARDLGMVSLKDSIDLEKPPNDKDDSEVGDDHKVIEYVDCVVEKGDTLEDVASKLYELNLIDDKEEFILFTEDKNLDKKFNYGTFQIKYNTSYSTIIKILTD